MEKLLDYLDSRPFKPGFRNMSVQFVLRHITKNCFFYCRNKYITTI